MIDSSVVTTWRLGSRLMLLLLVVSLGSGRAVAEAIGLGEALDNTSLAWTTGGDAEWFGQTAVYYYGGDAAQSGNMPGSTNQSSWIQTTVTGPGILSFHWRVSPGAMSELVFYMDGVKKSDCWTYSWQRMTYVIPSGDHTLKWDYAPFIHTSSMAGFLDRVVYLSGPAILVESPNGGETWKPRDYRGIRWMASEGVGPSVRLELLKGGTPVFTISSSTENSGYYGFFLPPTLDPGVDYRVKVASTSAPSISGSSDGDFTISASPQSAFSGLLVLDGVDDYAETQYDSELDVGNGAGASFTIEAWVNSPGYDRLTISKSESYSLSMRDYMDYSTGTGRLVGCVGMSLTSPSGQQSGREICRWPTYSGDWRHVAGVFYQDTGRVQLYLNGSAFGEPWTFGPTINRSTTGLRIGAHYVSGVDEVRLSDVARYTGTSYITPTMPFACDEHTRALWHLDECAGATVFHDECGAVDNHLTAYNGAHTEGVAGPCNTPTNTPTPAPTPSNTPTGTPTPTRTSTPTATQGARTIRLPLVLKGSRGAFGE